MLGVTLKEPVAGPVAVGAKRTTWVTEPPAGMTVPAPMVGATALKGLVGRVTLLSDSELPPVFDRTTLAVALEPTATEPKPTLVGCTTSWPGVVVVGTSTRTLLTRCRLFRPPVAALKPSRTWLGRLDATSSTRVPSSVTCSRPLTTRTSTGTVPLPSRVRMAVLVPR